MNFKKNLLFLGGLAFSMFTVISVTQNSAFSKYFTSKAECDHGDVVHHDRVEPTLINPGVEEYWCCCTCHTSFKDEALTEVFENTDLGYEDPEDERYLKNEYVSLNKRYASTNFALTTETEGQIPIGLPFKKVFKGQVSGQFVIEAGFDASEYSRIGFAVKSPQWWYCLNDVELFFYNNEWVVVEAVQTAPGTWSVYAAKQNNNFNYVLKGSNIVGTDLKDILGIKGNVGDYYVTNIIGRKSSPGRLIAESSVESFTIYEGEEFDAPRGFDTVTVGTKRYVDNDQGKTFLRNIPFMAEKVESLKFAFATKNKIFTISSWQLWLTEGEWYFVSIERNVDTNTFTTTVKDKDGNVKITVENVTSFEKALIWYNNNGSNSNEPAIWYSTEVRGELMSTGETEVIDECAIKGRVEESLDFCPPGFDNTYKWINTYRPFENEIIPPSPYSTTDLTDYNSVTFAYKTNGYALFDNWSVYKNESPSWYVVTFTKNGSSWDLTIVNLTGKVLHSQSDKTGNTLSELTLRMIPQQRNNTQLYIIVTELRVTPDTVEVIIDDSVITTDAEVYADDTRPSGFDNTYKWLNTDRPLEDAIIPAIPFSTANLNAYRSITFAYKTNGFVLFDGWRSWDEAGNSDTWYIVTFTKNGSSWDLRITTSAGEKYTQTGMTNSTLPNLTYEMRPQQKNNTQLYVIVTELRGILK